MAEETLNEKITRIETELADVRKSKKASLSGQSMSMAGRSVTRVDYNSLCARERELESLLKGLYANRDCKPTQHYQRFRIH